VALLNRHGFHTTDSGDGVTNVEAGMGCAVDYPHVCMVVRDEYGIDDGDQLVREATRLHKLIQKWTLTEIGPMSDDPQVPGIQATFDPGDGSALITLVGVTDDMLDEEEIATTAKANGGA
jgi:hypothetical protein